MCVCGQVKGTGHVIEVVTALGNGRVTALVTFLFKFISDTSTPPLLPNITAVLCWAQLGHSLLHCYTATQNEIYTFNRPHNFFREIRPESIPVKCAMTGWRETKYTKTNHLLTSHNWESKPAISDASSYSETHTSSDTGSIGLSFISHFVKLWWIV